MLPLYSLIEKGKNMTSIITVFSRIVTMLLVFPLHESAHALVAKWCGDDTAERQGRISLNPFAHLDLMGSLLIMFTGFGWAKPVPVDPRRMKNQRAGIALTSLAGPLSNFIASFVSMLAFVLIAKTESGYNAWTSSQITPLASGMLLLQYLSQVNIGLAMFNLIPFPPLDGFGVLRFFTGEKFERWYYNHQQEASIGFFAVILLMNYSKHSPLDIATSFVYSHMFGFVLKITGIT